jgi:hypothetical protein
MNINGSIAEQGTLEKLNSSGSYLALLKTQYKDQVDNEMDPQRLEAREVTIEDYDQVNRIDSMDEELTRQNGDFALYLYYFGSVHWASSAFWMSFFVLEGVAPKLSELLVKIWVSSLEVHGSAVNSFYLGLYALVSITTAFALVGGAYHLFMFFAPRSAITLHERLLTSVMHAPLSFFTSVDTGTTMNR